jgi:hypothetical protein
MAGNGSRSGSGRAAGGATGFANGVRRVAKPGGGTFGLRAGNVVSRYRPATLEGQKQQLERQIGKAVGQISDAVKGMREPLGRAKKIGLRVDRMVARDIARGSESLRYNSGKVLESGKAVIRRRAERAAAVAARGRAAGARAQELYGRQLAGWPRGNDAKSRRDKLLGRTKPAKNNYRPGPNNSNGTPKRRRSS